MNNKALNIGIIVLVLSVSVFLVYWFLIRKDNSEKSKNKISTFGVSESYIERYEGDLPVKTRIVKKDGSDETTITENDFILTQIFVDVYDDEGNREKMISIWKDGEPMKGVNHTFADDESFGIDVSVTQNVCDMHQNPEADYRCSTDYTNNVNGTTYYGLTQNQEQSVLSLKESTEYPMIDEEHDDGTMTRFFQLPIQITDDQKLIVVIAEEWPFIPEPIPEDEQESS